MLLNQHSQTSHHKVGGTFAVEQLVSFVHGHVCRTCTSLKKTKLRQNATSGIARKHLACAPAERTPPLVGKPSACAFLQVLPDDQCRRTSAPSACQCSWVRSPQNAPATELEHASVTIHCHDGRAQQCQSSADCKACRKHWWGNAIWHCIFMTKQVSSF